MFDKLRNFRGESFFKRAAMNILVKMSTEEEVELMTKQFKAIDTNNSGTIDHKEIKAYIKKQKIFVTD